MKAEIATIDHKEFGLELAQAETITDGLKQILEERTVLSKSYSEVIELEINEENIPKFKELRLKIRDNRTKGLESWHKVNKEFYLRGGQFVDAIKRKEIVENERMEENLKSNEDHFDNLERERLENLQIEREGIISKYVEDADQMKLAEMEEDVFAAFLTAKKASFDAKIEAEQKEAEEKAAAEKAEKERLEKQRLENERLKKETKLKEKRKGESGSVKDLFPGYN